MVRTDIENFIYSTKQAYITLETELIAAASLKIDTTPTEGFDAEKFDCILGPKEKNLIIVVLLTVCYRYEEKDWNATLKKVRLPLNELATYVK